MRTLLLFLVAAGASAQPSWHPALEGPSASLDVLHALGDEVDHLVTDDAGNLLEATGGVASTAVVLSGRVPFGRLVATLEVPFAAVGFETPPSFEGEFQEGDVSVGNTAVGLEARLRPDLEVGVTVRVPLFNDFDDRESFGWQGGLAADAERFEAYVPDVVTLEASATAAASLGPVGLRARLAPTVFRDVSGAENAFGDNETSVALGYAVHGDVRAGPATLSAGLVGRPFLAGDRFEVLETTATLALGASLEVGGVRPRVAARVPLDGARPYFDSAATVGFGLGVPLR